MAKSLSVIIPLAADESELSGLSSDLMVLPRRSELIFVSCQGSKQIESGILSILRKAFKVICLISSPGRARQMNLGAKRAGGEMLWFIHADSRFKPCAVQKLLDFIEIDETRFFYFDLKFSSGVVPLTVLNAWAANIRSRYLGVPFGDQAFCMSKKNFFRLGSYDETCVYGEDHLLVWSARSNGMRLHRIEAVIETSPRKYLEKGWFCTSAVHVCKTIRQGLPFQVTLLARLIKRKCGIRERAE